MTWTNYQGWNWPAMGGTMILVLGAVLALAIWAVRTSSGPRRGSDSAMDTVRQRLAPGQISQEEFGRTRKTLQG